MFVFLKNWNVYSTFLPREYNHLECRWWWFKPPLVVVQQTKDKDEVVSSFKVSCGSPWDTTAGRHEGSQYWTKVLETDQHSKEWIFKNDFFVGPSISTNYLVESRRQGGDLNCWFSSSLLLMVVVVVVWRQSPNAGRDRSWSRGSSSSDPSQNIIIHLSKSCRRSKTLDLTLW